MHAPMPKAFKHWRDSEFIAQIMGKLILFVLSHGHHLIRFPPLKCDQHFCLACLQFSMYLRMYARHFFISLNESNSTAREHKLSMFTLGRRYGEKRIKPGIK